MESPLLDVRDLKKYFPITSGILRHKIGEIKAVDGISFNIHKGEVVGLVGESGSGKSTAGRTIIGLLEPTSGEILFQGQNIQTFSREQKAAFRKKVQIVFQDPYSSLNPRKTIGESMGEALLYHHIVQSIKEQNERVADLLEQVGMPTDAMYRYPHQFSGGQQQRICIGRALAMNPELIICDEALSALDVSVQAQIINLLSHLKNKFNLSFLFISHDLSMVRYFCDHVVVIHLGKVMESGETSRIFQHPQHPYTQALLAAIPATHPRKQNK